MNNYNVTILLMKTFIKSEECNQNKLLLIQLNYCHAIWRAEEEDWFLMKAADSRQNIDVR